MKVNRKFKVLSKYGIIILMNKVNILLTEAKGLTF